MSTALVPVEARGGSLPSAGQWALLKEQATLAFESGLLPAHIKTPVQAIVIAAKGRELGVPPLYALANIGVINGKPVCSAELMLALIYRDQGDDAVHVVETSDEVAAFAYKRRGWAKYEQCRFTIEDAKRAQLGGNQWQKYPAAMLRARCISAMARMAFADSIGGMFTADELGGAVTVTADGAVELDLAPAPDPAPQPLRTTNQRTGEVAEQPAPAPVDQTARRRAIKAALTEEYERLATAWRALDPEADIEPMANTPNSINAQLAQMQQAVDALNQEQPF